MNGSSDKPYRVIYYPDFEPRHRWLRANPLLIDEVTRIVPQDVVHRDTESVARLVQALPGSITAISPSADEVYVDDLNLKRLGAAFQLIREEKQSQRNRTHVTIFEGGDFSVAGHTFMHNYKIADEVRRLLNDNNLISHEFDGVIGTTSNYSTGGWTVTNTQASDLILSCIASKIATNHEIDAITDRPLDYAVNALNSFSVGPNEREDAIETTLLSAVASVSIPYSIGSVSVTEYCTLRDSFSDIRPTFQSLVREMADARKLDRVKDPSEMVARIERAAKEFDKARQQYERTRYKQSFSRWGATSIAGAISLPNAFLHPAMSTLATGTGLLIQLIGITAGFSVRNSDETQCYHQLSRLRKRLDHLMSLNRVF